MLRQKPHTHRELTLIVSHKILTKIFFFFFFQQAWVQKAKALSDQSGHENSKKRKLSSEDGNMTRKSGQDDQKRMKKAESASQGKIVLSQSTNAKLAKFAKSD